MAEKIVVGYDGSESSHRALTFAADRARAIGATLVIAHVLEWSPYSFLTPTELEERHKRRSDELARAESALIAPVVKDLAGSGLSIETELKYGHIAETLCKIASEHQASQVVIGRTGHSNMASRLFGSVAGSLAQIAPAPVTIVP
ncbi:universal stress protein [uncultured Paracoccus sp.]|uniref:universal stress protein n=1 Tax=uncultured Paracoccus sp. TaxID=189685 RepID=UPI0026291D0C|nr:universal stress protein [uncultured Paracoccus sp.]